MQHAHTTTSGLFGQAVQRPPNTPWKPPAVVPYMSSYTCIFQQAGARLSARGSGARQGVRALPPQVT